jgi:hypothetical protein
MLKGFQIQRTSAIPANLGDAGKESEIYFADFNDVVIGEDGNMKVSFAGSLLPGRGWQSGFRVLP